MNIYFYTNIFILCTIYSILMTNQEQIPIERKISQTALTQKIKDLEKELKILNRFKIY